ncbi:hypothetical protein DL96DRAFT_1606403 [Flagelloscypha sp. PMI_526]|nr:hypothetical protein DL96DRAFT_1606403 [Flagelloscypha sp. PMI_526]
MTSDLTGYIRWTDVQFKWKDLAPRTDTNANPLAALLSITALVHPDHPLRLPGDDGIRLYQCSIKNENKLRLCFSTAQLQYLQYYLQAVGLTKRPLSLPSSKFILKEADVEDVEPVTFNDAALLKKAYKTIEKVGKHLLGMPADTKAKFKLFDQGRNYWASKLGTWLCLDFEEWERDHSVLLECGYSMRHFEDGVETLEEGHIIVSDYVNYRNGTWVVDRKDNYKFGDSQRLNKSKTRTKVHNLILESLARGPLFLLFHNFYGDMKTLESLSAPLSDLWKDEYPDEVTKELRRIFVFDTAILFSALEGSPTGQTRKLEVVCDLLNIETQLLHNAGNDAHYTLQAAREMLSAETAHLQQQHRWPKFGKHRTEVKFPAWRVDEDGGDDSDSSPEVDTTQTVMEGKKH